MPPATTLRLALASDTVSIFIMEVVDNGIMLLVPGAMDAALTELWFWASLTGSLLLAGLAAFPVNRWLIAHGRGHALVHPQHQSSAVSPNAERSMDDSAHRRYPSSDGHHNR
jgi:hypothetical protein